MLILTHDDNNEVTLSEQDITDVMFRLEAAARCERYRLGGIVSDLIVQEGKPNIVCVLGVVQPEFPISKDREYRHIAMVYVPKVYAS